MRPRRRACKRPLPLERGVFKQPRYEVRPQPLPLIDQEKRHLLYLNRHHASIVMTSVVSASIAWNPFSTAQAAIISAFIKVLLSEIADEPSLAVPLVQ